jgi:hypothetical protein
MRLETYALKVMLNVTRADTASGKNAQALACMRTWLSGKSSPRTRLRLIAERIMRERGLPVKPHWPINRDSP